MVSDNELLSDADTAWPLWVPFMNASDAAMMEAGYDRMTWTLVKDSTTGRWCAAPDTPLPCLDNWDEMATKAMWLAIPLSPVPPVAEPGKSNLIHPTSSRVYTP